MAVEKYLAGTSLGLFIMFVAEIITLFYFLIDPKDIIEPNSYILQFISIGVAPACILAAVSFIMSKRYGSKLIGSLIIAGGVTMLIGMLYSNTLIDQIQPELQVSGVIITPPLFMIISIPVMIFGALLFRIREKKPKKKYV